MSPEYLISGEGMDLAENLMESKKLGFFAVDEVIVLVNGVMILTAIY